MKPSERKERLKGAVGKGFRFTIVVSRFNGFITDRLEAGALRALTAGSTSSDDITVVRVPGAFEIPAAARHAALLDSTGSCLGCVIRGARPIEYSASAVAPGSPTPREPASR